MIIALVIALIVCVALIVLLANKNAFLKGRVLIYEARTAILDETENLEKKNATLEDQWTKLSAKTSEAAAAFEEMSGKVSEAAAKLDVLNYQISQAQDQRREVELQATKDLAAEREARRTEFENQLAKEFQEIQKSHPAQLLKDELDQLNSEIKQAKETLRIQQEQALQKEQQEEFFATHSVNLTEGEKADITKIMDFAPQLSRFEAFCKLVWTEYYQKPLQKLCKELGADKITGIYKITAQDGRCYIGQALDIGSRWKEHMKCALGIGTTGYMTNKFYRTMHKEGPENFTFEVLEICPKSKLDERERYWIEFYNSTVYGFNTKIGG